MIYIGDKHIYDYNIISISCDKPIPHYIAIGTCISITYHQSLNKLYYRIIIKINNSNNIDITKKLKEMLYLNIEINKEKDIYIFKREGNDNLLPLSLI